MKRLKEISFYAKNIFNRGTNCDFSPVEYNTPQFIFFFTLEYNWSDLPKGFSLMEMMVAIVIVGAVAAFAIPKYTKYAAVTYRDDAIRQLTAIYNVNNEYYLKAKPKAYWPGVSGSYDVTQINTNLGLNVVQNGMTYSCSGSSSTFTCTAVRNSANPFTITVTEVPLSATNPGCTSGACP